MSDRAANDPSEQTLKPGDSLRDGRYAIAGKLGEGGQATTFDAVDKREGRRVIVKRFRVRGASSWKEVELAEREAKVLAGIDHPNLPVYVDHFEEGGSLYLVTERIDGETVAALRAKGPLGEDDVLRFLRDASSALDYLHGRAPPLVHRDIKPSNVIRRPDGSFAIIDFGAVRDRLKVTGSTVVGTFGYMAPEQFQGRAMPASDVYAVGTTAVAMLTGREPEDLPHKGLAIDVEAALGPFVRPSLARALTAMLEPDPDKRAPRLEPLLAELRASWAAEAARQAPSRDRGGDRDSHAPFPAAEAARQAPPRDRGGDRDSRAPFPAAEAARQAPPRDAGRDRDAGRAWWQEPARWGDPALGEEAGREAQRAVSEAEQQVKRVVEEVGEQVRRVVAEVSAGHGEGAKREARRVAEVAKREAKRAFKEAQRAARHAGEEARQRAEESRLAKEEQARNARDAARRAREDARRAKEDARRARREARRAARRDAPLGGPVLLVVLLALTVAQLAVLLGLKVVAPVVLYVVSALFFGSVPGRAMRAAARHVYAAGSTASAAIGRAKDVVRGRAPEAAQGTGGASPEAAGAGANAASPPVLGTGPVNPHDDTAVSTAGRAEHVDPFAHTAVSTVSDRPHPASATSAVRQRFPDEPAARAARIGDERDTDVEVEEEARAEEEAAAKKRR
jgi:hypothetical protein